MIVFQRSRVSRRTALALLTGTLLFTLTSSLWAAPPAFPPAKPSLNSGPSADAVGDPPGVLDDIDSSFIVDLAARLSTDRGWLTPETLRALDDGSLRLKELFPEAPDFFTKDGTVLYRLEIERVGAGWDAFDPSTDRFAVFLTHEIYTGLGLDRALALEDGQQTVLFAQDMDTFHLFALSVHNRASDQPLPKSATVASFEEPVRLGEARLKVNRFDPALVEGFAAFPTKAGCAAEVAPASCSGMVPVCAAGAAPHFILTSVKIRTDHEGLFKGKPEIELFPLNIDGASSGSTTGTSTPFIFSGRTILDSAGRSRFLPDVNSNNVWYSVSGGVAICPTTLGNEWAATLVEDDNTTGVLKIPGSKINKVKVFRHAVQSAVALYRMDFLKFATNFIKLLFGLFSGDGDDLYQESIGITGDLFCNDGLGQPAPKIFTLASQEWDLQGYFACLNPTCAPLTASITGPSQLDMFTSGTYTVNVGSGVSPFTYRWTQNGAFVGSGSSVTVSDSNSFTIAVTVTDAAGQTATSSRSVFVFNEMCGQFFC